MLLVSGKHQSHENEAACACNNLVHNVFSSTYSYYLGSTFNAHLN